MNAFSEFFHPRANISMVLCIALSVLRSSAQTTQKVDQRVHNVVLVHGAWADGSGWKGVYDILSKDGYNVSVVQEPETSFEDDVEATKRVLSSRMAPAS